MQRVGRVLAVVALVVVTVVVALVGAGCATASIGLPPVDADLRTDGSAESQARVFRKYELTYADGTFKRPGVDTATVGAEVHTVVHDVATAVTGDDARTFVAASAGAKAALDSPAAGMDRGVHLLGPGIALGGSFVAGMIVGALFAPSFTGGSAASIPTLGFSVGIAFGILFMAPAAFLEALVLEPVSSFFAADAYRDAAAAWNADLQTRLARAAPAHRAAAAPHAVIDAPAPAAATDPAVGSPPPAPLDPVTP